MYSIVFSLFCFSCFNFIEGSNNCTGTSSLIRFDDLSTQTSSALISNGYFGLNWFNVYYTYVYSEPSQSGYYTALSSGSYDILNGYGNTMTISSPATAVFNISSFIAAAAWNDNLQLTINGQRNSTTVYQQTITLQVTTSSFVILNWTHIDTISFTTAGGTVNPMFAGTYSGIEFAMDNLCVDISSFYATTTQTPAVSTATSGSGGGGNGGSGGGGDGPDIALGVSLGGDTGLTLGIGELTTPAFGGIIGAAIGLLIILGFLLWCLISSKCCQQAPNCNGCGGGGC